MAFMAAYSRRREVHAEPESELDGRHSGLKAAAVLVTVMIHEPELHGRHGGLKAWAGDPRGPETRDGWPSCWPSKRRCLSMWSRSPVLGGRHCGPKAAAASVCGQSHTGWPPWRPEGGSGMCLSHLCDNGLERQYTAVSGCNRSFPN